MQTKSSAARDREILEAQVASLMLDRVKTPRRFVRLTARKTYAKYFRVNLWVWRETAQGAEEQVIARSWFVESDGASVTQCRPPLGE